MVNHCHLFTFSCMLLVCGAMQDFWRDSTSQSLDETAPRLRTLDLDLSIGRPATRSPRDLNGDDPASSRELRNAGQELRFNPVSQFVAQAEVLPNQTYGRGRDILASNDLSLSGPFRGTRDLVDNLHREAQSQLPRHGIRRKSNFPFVLSSAETTRGESAAPIGYPSMNPSKETIDLLAKFGASSNTKTTEPHLSLARCQSGLKRTLAEGSNHDSLKVRGKVIDCSTMGPVGKKAKTPLIQHQPEPLNNLQKSTPQRMGVFQKKLNSASHCFGESL
ncbi:hypothetical protein KEM48_007557 [Puccinia striiformis f. sp. tritici PST-130]|nr:hypothetical protein KEM48_007557 [Puccinia striiformis f. sp. tritici PST-130]